MSILIRVDTPWPLLEWGKGKRGDMYLTSIPLVQRRVVSTTDMHVQVSTQVC